MSNLIRHWNGYTIRQRDDGYMCLTDIAQLANKRFSNWYRLSSTQSFLTQLANSENVQISQLVEIKQGGKMKDQGTWGHPLVAKEFDKWCSKRNAEQNSIAFESAIRDSLAKNLNGSTEIPCKTGFVDVLTTTDLIEVKRIKDWKDAVGQALVYHLEFPNHSPRIHLFGSASDEYKCMIVLFCLRLGISVSFE